MNHSSRFRQAMICNLVWLLLLGGCSGTNLDAMALLGGVSQISDGDPFEEETLSGGDGLGELEEITADEIAEGLSEEIPQSIGEEPLGVGDTTGAVEVFEEVVSGGQATDEAIEESETDLTDITLADLPVTIAKGDGGEEVDPDSGYEECSADDVETISLGYTEENVTRRRMRGLGTVSTPLVKSILAGILLASTEESSEAEGLNDAFVFLLPRAIVLDSESDGEFSIETCEVFSDDEEGVIYRWTELNPEELAGLQLETGRVRLRLQQALVNRRDSILEFTGMASRFHLSAADFGDETLETTPFIILR